MTSTRRLLLWIASIAAVGLVAIVAIGVAVYPLIRPDRLKARLERAASAHLHLETTFGDLKIEVFPRAGIEGHHLELRQADHPELPPFIAIDHFTVDATPVALVIGLIRGHVGLVHVDGMKIVVPPGDKRPKLPKSDGEPSTHQSRIVVDHLVSHDAQLTILRKKPGDKPLVFDIHELEMEDLGFDRVIPFKAKLTNPVPTGEVASTGSIGPWQDTPSDLPVLGNYEFTNANLGTIKGIAGNLTSTGHYDGTLTRIRVVGESTTPDFNLDLGGKPVPLSAKFTTVVDGTNGSTYLESVDARLYETPIHVTGDIVNLVGPQGFDIKLQAAIAKGRIEDVLRLVMNNTPPLFTGELSLTSAVRLPPGEGKVRDRLQLDGRFNLEQTKFSSGEIQQKLTELSRRSQGKDEDEKMSRVMSNLDGQFHMGAGVLSLRNMTFAVPGADVRLTGTYALKSGEIDFEGTLRMQATISKAVGGFRSVFLKPFDFVFRKNGAGAEIPIKITGTRDQPKFGLRMGGK